MAKAAAEQVLPLALKSQLLSVCCFAPWGCFPGGLVLCGRAVWMGGGLTGPHRLPLSRARCGKLGGAGSGSYFGISTLCQGPGVSTAPCLDPWSRSHQGKLLVSQEELQLTSPPGQITAFPQCPVNLFSDCKSKPLEDSGGRWRRAQTPGLVWLSLFKELPLAV